MGHPQHQTARQQALLLLARRSIDSGGHPAARRSAANAGSVMSRSEVRGSAQTCNLSAFYRNPLSSFADMEAEILT